MTSTHEFGMGHLFRMVNLWRVFKSNSNSSIIVLLDSDSNSENWLKRNHIDYEAINSSDKNWEYKLIDKYNPHVWINDRLNTNAEHVIKLCEKNIAIVTFDDYGSGSEYSDIHISALSKVLKKEAKGKIVLTGVEYLILSDEIKQYKRLRSKANELVVTLGGSDTYGITVEVVRFLVESNLSATVILGPSFMHHKELSGSIKGNRNITIKMAVPSLIKELSKFDLAITAGGITAFECASAGLPTFSIASEEHEIEYCTYLMDRGCSVYGGFRKDVDLSKFNKINDIQLMSQNGINNIPLTGLDNVFHKIIDLTNT